MHVKLVALMSSTHTTRSHSVQRYYSYAQKKNALSTTSLKLKIGKKTINLYYCLSILILNFLHCNCQIFKLWFSFLKSMAYEFIDSFNLAHVCHSCVQFLNYMIQQYTQFYFVVPNTNYLAEQQKTATLPYRTCMKFSSRIQAYTKHALFMQSIIRFTSYVEQSISN